MFYVKHFQIFICDKHFLNKFDLLTYTYLLTTSKCWEGGHIDKLLKAEGEDR